MRKACYPIFMLFTLLVQVAEAQVSRVMVNTRGKFEVTVKVGENAYVVINNKGRVVESNIHGNISYYSNFHSYEAGKLKNIGNINFTYYSDFHDYESGKIKKVGNTNITYYSNFHSYESGKIKQIGDVRFTYYSDFHSYESGKVKSIGNTSITYYSDFFNYEAGKLKSIGSASYKYNSSGQLQSGPNHTEQNGMRFGLWRSH